MSGGLLIGARARGANDNQPTSTDQAAELPRDGWFEEYTRSAVCHSAMGWPQPSRGSSVGLLGDCKQFAPDERLGILLICIFLLASAAFPFNDAHDFAIDRTAHNRRPLVLGDLSPRSARILGAAMVGAALLLTAFLGLLAIIAAALFTIPIVLYSHLKATSAVLENIVTAILFGAALPSPFFIQDGAFDVVLLFELASLCTLIVFGREIAKDIEDSTVDAAYGRRSIPILYGTVAGYRLSAASVFAAGICSIAIAAGASGGGLPIASLVLAGILLAMAGRLLFTRRDSEATARVAELKAILITSLLLLAIGSAT